jgi:predicted metal-dependent HD superfamily phosphohydrolase
MAVLIDPPSWPAHGTVFSHLVSTSSLRELHAFADAAGIPRRAFDEDHYDVPERRYRELVDRGAEEVSGTDLVRALIASGLRIPARRRGPKLRAALASRWRTLLPQAPDLGEELLDRWGEQHRRYHTPTHLLAVLEALDVLLDPPNDALRRPVLLAAWFHDAVYQGTAGDDERASADLAVKRLAGLIPSSEVREVERLVLLTIGHDPAEGDRAGQLLCDADLAVLGGSESEYQRYAAAVREEYAHIPNAAFIEGRRSVLTQLIALDPLFRTATGRQRWADRALRNLRHELDLLG